MTDFIDDGTSLPFPKVQWDGTSDEIAQPTMWCRPTDWNTVCSGLVSARTAILRGVVNVKHYGAKGDGTTDDTSAVQAAITATPGQTLYFPKGKYKITSTLTITDRGHHLVGDCGVRNSANGTEISFTGTGPCIKIGVDDGNAWDANEYNGPQDQVFENLWFSHGAPDTSLVSANLGSTAVYKAGAYGIWDWRGGAIKLQRVGIEGFEANFVGVNSDIDSFDDVQSFYSKYGIYLGPRSDQCAIRDLYSIFCDRAVTIDRAGQTRILQPQLVGCGTSTAAAVEIRQGSYGTVIESPWFEHGQGYQGTDQLSFVSAGEVAGYGSGGSIQSPGGTPTTSSVVGLDISSPTILSIITGQPAHTRFLVSVYKCQQLVLDHPIEQPGSALTNFDALVGIQAANAPTNVDTQIEVRGVPSTLSLAHIYTNLGAGSPNVSIAANGSSGQMAYSTSRFHFLTPGATAGADDVQLSQEGLAGEVWIQTPNLASGQITRLRLARSIQPGTSSAAPSSGTWQQGDRVFVTDPAASGFAAWVCVTGGTPGTWAKEGLMAATSGTLVIPNASTIGGSSANVTTLNGQLAVVPAAGTTGVNSNNSNAGQSGTNACLKGLQNGTYDTTAGFTSSIGVQGQAVSTRSAGASTLQNIGGQFTASGAQDNQALQTVNGDVQLNTTSGVTKFNNSCIGVGTRAAAPSTGTHVAGEVVFNIDPIAGGTVGWVCVTGGSPGTWKTFGTVDPSASLTGSRGGDFGDGNLGAATFDGSTAVTGCTRSGSVYTATKDLAFTTATFSSGVTLDLSGGTAGFELMCSVSLVGPGSGTATIKCDGNAASGSTGGAALTTGSPIGATSGLGASGIQNAGQGGGASSTWQTSFKAGNGGNGGASATNAGATGGTVGTTLTDAQAAMICWDDIRRARVLTGTILGGGGGGASGGGTTGVAAGGGGGGGAGWCRIAARLITNGAQFVFSANGGNGAAGTGGNAGGGGGGGGGYCIVAHGGATTPTGLVISTNVLANGGAAGAAAGIGSAGTAGTAGQVRIFSMGIS